MAAPAFAQPTYEEDIARQRAEEARIQQDWIQDEDDAAAAAAEDDYEPERRSYFPPPPRFADSHMAVAWNFDTSEVWATLGHRTGDEAEKAALSACNRIMGGGCMIGAHWINNSFIAVAHDAYGLPWVRGGANFSSVAESDALEYCRKNSVGCKVTQVYAYTPLPLSAPAGLDLTENHFPPGPIARHKFALVAWPESQPADRWRGSVWLSTGEQNWRQARDRLLAKCQADTGTPCTMGTTVANGVLVRYVNDKGVIFWVGAPDAAAASARVNKLCTNGSRCWVVETTDTGTPRFKIIDENKMRAPGRGFFSLAWGSKWPKMVVATGRRTSADAIAAAVSQCAAQSKERCVSYFDDEDLGNGQYLAVYKDTAGNVRTYIGLAPDELEYRAKLACTKAQVTCTQRAMIDLSQATTQTFGI